MHISDTNLKELGIPVPHNTLIKKAVYSYLKLDKINHLLGDTSEQTQGLGFIETVFDRLTMSYAINESELKNIPAEGPFLVVDNHPFGFLDDSGY